MSALIFYFENGLNVIAFPIIFVPALISFFFNSFFTYFFDYLAYLLAIFYLRLNKDILFS